MTLFYLFMMLFNLLMVFKSILLLVHVIIAIENSLSWSDEIIPWVGWSQSTRPLGRVLWRNPTHGIISSGHGKLLSIPIITCIHYDTFWKLASILPWLFFLTPSESICRLNLTKTRLNNNKNNLYNISICHLMCE